MTIAIPIIIERVLSDRDCYGRFALYWPYFLYRDCYGHFALYWHYGKTEISVFSFHYI